MSVKPKSDRHEKTFQWGRSNFLQEARTLARFEHPSIVRVSRVYEANSTAYMVMRFEQGQSFEDWLKGLGRPPTQDELDAIVAPAETVDLVVAVSGGMGQIRHRLLDWASVRSRHCYVLAVPISSPR